MIKAALLGKIFSSIFQAKQEVAKTIGKAEALDELRRQFRIEFITHFTKRFTEEMQYNLQEYVKKLSEISMEGEIAQRDIATLNFKFDKLIYDYTQIVEKEFDNSSNPIIQEIEKQWGVRKSVVTADKLKFPALAWVNREISPPAANQPIVLQKTDFDGILQKLLSIYDNIELENL